MKFISLFAGVGGIDLGFEQAGFKCVYANEWDANACKTYNANHKIKVDNRDIWKVPIEEIPDFNILCAGFPCQKFSMMGKRKGFEDDNQGVLFFAVLEIVKARHPEVIFLENVRGIVSQDKGNTLKTILFLLEEEGYHCYWKIMNTKDYGNLPQSRPRWYCVCFKKQVDFKFPEPIELTCQQTEIINRDEKVDDYFYNRVKNSKIYPQVLELLKEHPLAVFQYTFNKPSYNKEMLIPCILANHTGACGSRFGPRKLTPREVFRAQGFPEDFIINAVSINQASRQAGNSVSVPVIRRIAEKIKNIL